MSPLVELINVGRDFDSGRIVAVEDVSLAIEDDETVAIVGRSGSGKSTILNLVCGLDRPTRALVVTFFSAMLWTAVWNYR